MTIDNWISVIDRPYALVPVELYTLVYIFSIILQVLSGAIMPQYVKYVYSK